MMTIFRMNDHHDHDDDDDDHHHHHPDDEHDHEQLATVCPPRSATAIEDFTRKPSQNKYIYLCVTQI